MLKPREARINFQSPRVSWMNCQSSRETRAYLNLGRSGDGGGHDLCCRRRMDLDLISVVADLGLVDLVKRMALGGLLFVK